MPSDNTASRREAALLRLSTSRLQLRQQLLGHRPDSTVPGAFDVPRRLRAMWRLAKRSLRSSPATAIALTAVQQWWQGHPWHSAGELIVQEAQAVLRPLVRRHPIATVLVAGAAGALILRAKPWRWPLVTQQLRLLPTRLTRWAFAQLLATRAPF